MSNQLTVTESNNVLIVSGVGPQGPAGAGGGGGVTDGDKGDITISNSGTVYTIDADAVTFDKIANVTGPTLIGRQAATSGSVEAIGLGSGLTIDGSKNLALSATYAQQSLTLTAGTGLTGGGDLSANRSFAVAFGSTASTACEGNDARLSDARTPTAHGHAASEITSGALDIARIPTGSTASTVCIGNDARLSDARTPTAHTHALADLTQSGATTNQVVTWNGSVWAPATPSGGGGGGNDQTSSYVLFTDFVENTQGDWLYGTGGTGGDYQSVTVANRIGVVLLRTGTTASINRYVQLRSHGWLADDLAFQIDFEAEVTIPFNTSGAEGFHLVGVDDGFNAGAPSNGMFFRATDGGNWYAVTANAGAETATDTGIAGDATYRKFRITHTTSGTRQVEFKIDGTTVATHTTNLSTDFVHLDMRSVRTGATGTSCRMAIDWMRLSATRVNALSFT